MSLEPRHTDDRRDTAKARVEADPALNPALQPRKDETYNTTRRTPAPADSASVRGDEGRRWPIVWAVVVIACVLITIYLLV